MMPDAVEAVQAVVRYASAGSLEAGRSERGFELVFGGVAASIMPGDGS